MMIAPFTPPSNCKNPNLCMYQACPLKITCWAVENVSPELDKALDEFIADKPASIMKDVK